MTATVPDVGFLEALDWTPELPCDVNTCREDPQPSVMMAVLTLPCHTATSPVCVEHVPVVQEWIREDAPITCNMHHTTTGAASCVRLVPL